MTPASLGMKIFPQELPGKEKKITNSHKKTEDETPT